jgi:hypothetical protein
MQLYQAAYGWTELRFYALAGIAWLGVGVVAAIVLIARDATRWLLHAVGIAGLGVALGVNLLAPSAFVARQNLERVIAPANLPPDAYRGADVLYLVSLGDGAVPTLVELLPRLESPSRELLGSHLRTYALRRAEAEPLGPWQAQSVDRVRARAALLATADELRAYPPFR